MTSIGPAIRVILKLRVPADGIIRRIRGSTNSAGHRVNYQWPLRAPQVTISSVHLWCWDGHESQDAAIAALNITQHKKLRALLRDAEEFLTVIPPDDRDRADLDIETATPAPARIPPAPPRPRGSAGEHLLALRKKLKRQRQWIRRHRQRIADMRLPQPPKVVAAPAAVIASAAALSTTSSCGAGTMHDGPVVIVASWPTPRSQFLLVPLLLAFLEWPPSKHAQVCADASVLIGSHGASAT